MRYFKTFFHVLKNSFSSAKYYNEVIKTPFSFSLKYFLFFSLLLSIVTTVFLSVSMVIPLNEFLAKVPRLLVKVYPAELEVRIRKGQVSTNVEEPYYIPLQQVEQSVKEEFQVKGATSEEIRNLVVIDTAASVEDLSKYQTAVLVTKQYLSYRRDDGRIETFPFSNIDDVTINQNMMQRVAQYISPFLMYVPLVVILLLFFGSLFWFVTSQLIYLLFTALALYLVGKWIKYDLNYHKAYQVDMHLATIFTPMFLILGWANLQVSFPFLRLILYTVVGAFILNKIKSAKA